MRNMKKFLALVLAMMMMLSVAVFNTSAAEEADYTEAALFLNSLAVMQGSTDGDLMLDAGVERYQAALFFARCLTGKTGTEIWNGTPASAYFTDVTMYGTAIDYAYGMGVVKGRGGNTFGASDKIIYQDMIVMAVRALGYETENMSYPWGHIIAAEKLDLLAGIDNVNYKAVMTRGEVAQLLENTLRAQIARIDPVSKAPLYVGEVNSLGTTIAVDSTNTLLNKAGFVDSEAVVVTFVESKFWTDEEKEKNEDLYDYVTVELADTSRVNVKVEDLGITEETLKKSYYGLTAELYFSYEDGEVAFDQTNYDEEALSIIYVARPTYETVECLGDGSVKYTVSNGKHYITLGSEKIEFTDGKTLVTVKKWTGSAWNTLSVADAITYVETLAYNKGYADGVNAFGNVQYRTWTEGEQDYAEVLVTEYSFALYNEREIKYAATSEVETFKTYATYAAGTDINGDATYYATEKLFASNSAVTSSTTSVTKRNGEDNLAMTVNGSAKAGEFVIYDYNALDNVLTIAATAGSIETGRLSGQNTTKGTYKIGGTSYEFAGVAGVAANNAVAATYATVIAQKGDNVQYALYNGKIFFVAPYSETADEATVDFAIIDATPAKVAEVLEVEVADLEVTASGLVVADGYVVVAMLNLTTGEWETANVAGVALTYDDADNVKAYKSIIDIAEIAQFVKVGVAASADYTNACAVLTGNTIVVVVENEDGAYTLAAESTAVVDGTPATYAPIVKNSGSFALNFSAAGLSNKVTADSSVEAARIQTAESTVIVAINGSTVKVRTGVQNARADLTDITAFYAADANLVVALTTADVAAWADATLANENINYYVVTPAYNADVNYNEETEKYDITVEGLYDLSTFAMADAMTWTVADVATNDTIFANSIVKFDTTSETFATTSETISTAIVALHSESSENALAEKALTAFEDANTIAIADIANTTVAVSGINVKVATLDLTGFDWATMDADTMYIDTAVVDGAYDVAVDTFVDTNSDGYVTNEDDVFYVFSVDADAEVVELDAPEADVLDDFIIAMAGQNIKVTDEDGTVHTFTYTLSTYASKDAETDTVTAIVLVTLQ